jgi:hypothetical protein
MKEYTSKEQILQSIALSKSFTEHAVVALYKRQTADEQASAATLEHNKQGFNGVDAEILTSFAEQLLGIGKTWKGYPRTSASSLSEKQLLLARKKLQKYAGQLLLIAQENFAAAAVATLAVAAPAEIQTVVNPDDCVPSTSAHDTVFAMLSTNSAAFIAEIAQNCLDSLGTGWPKLSGWYTEIKDLALSL